MSQLHTVNHSSLLPLCAKFLEPGDVLLLIEDGVYCCNGSDLDQVPGSIEVHVLHDDLVARGVRPGAGSRALKAYYDDFVRLCCEHAKVINWF